MYWSILPLKISLPLVTFWKCIFSYVCIHTYTYVCACVCVKQIKFFHQNSKTISKLATKKLGCHFQHNQQYKYCDAHFEKCIFLKS